MRAALLLAMVFSVAACVATTPTPGRTPTRTPDRISTPTPAPMSRPTPASEEPADLLGADGEPFDLAIGSTARIRGMNLRIRFVSVAEDSRCPEGVQCISAGQARILLDVSAAGERSAVIELSTARGSADAVHRGQTLRLLELTPHPSTKRRIQPSDYRARLVVGNL